MPAFSLCITGRVQGVFFRDATKRKAEDLGITGWVKNCEDGSVEIHAEGSEEALKELERWCHRGPTDAVVDHVDVVRETVARGCKRFEIVW